MRHRRAGPGTPQDMVARAQLLFFLTGLVSATWAARIPAIQEGLALSPGALGLAVLGLEAGAVAGLPAGGALVTRLGSRPILRLGFVTYPLALTAVALAPGLAALGAALMGMAFANSLVDVAMNVQGVALERRAGRSLMARMHAGHAFGVLAGGLAGTLAAAADVGVPLHFGAIAAVAVVAGEVAAGRLGAGGAEIRLERRPDADAAAPNGAAVRGRRRGALPLDRRLASLGAVAFCAFLLDGTASTWIAVQLRDGGATPALAAAGFTAFALSLAAGRLVADRLTERHGRAAVVRTGALLAAAGIAAALLAPTAGLAVAGWAAFGAGLARSRRPSSPPRRAPPGSAPRRRSRPSPPSATSARSPARR